MKAAHILAAILIAGLAAAPVPTASVRADDERARALDQYERGEHAAAAALLAPLAEGGDAEAQFLLGELYFAGSGVAKDRAVAAAWYRKAADAGDPRAQTQLARLYFYGSGVPKDPDQAVALFRAAAATGFARAQLGLGWAYERGRGVAQDPVSALAWYTLAADAGDPDAAIQRDHLAADLDTAERAEAAERARLWRVDQ